MFIVYMYGQLNQSELHLSLLISLNFVEKST